MKYTAIVLLIFLKILFVENYNLQRMLPYNFAGIDSKMTVTRQPQPQLPKDTGNNDKLIGLNMNYGDREEEYESDNEKPPKKPCAVVVLSNMQNPAMQSLLRKYRYDSNGVLIPSSVKYFIKLPQGLRDAPILVPLNDKAFSPVGGFVRYYKEVPPIPHTW